MKFTLFINCDIPNYIMLTLIKDDLNVILINIVGVLRWGVTIVVSEHSRSCLVSLSLLVCD